MSCPTGRFSADLFNTAIQNFDLWRAGFCAYGAPLGELVVGSVVYAAFGLNIFIRTGSLIIPFVLALILGGTIFAQTFAIVNQIAGMVILIVAPVAVSTIVFMLDRRG